MKYCFLILVCSLGYSSFAQTTTGTSIPDLGIASFEFSMQSAKNGVSNFSITKDTISVSQQPYGKPQEKYTVIKFATPKKEWDDLISQFDYSSFIKIKGGKSKLPEGYSDFILGVKAKKQDHYFVLDLANAQEIQSVSSWVEYFLAVAKKYTAKYGVRSDLKNTF